MLRDLLRDTSCDLRAALAETSIEKHPSKTNLLDTAFQNVFNFDFDYSFDFNSDLQPQLLESTSNYALHDACCFTSTPIEQHHNNNHDHIRYALHSGKS